MSFTPGPNFSPFRLPGRQYLNRAAVALIIALNPEPCILMLQRRTRADDPWSGDMAFPGGRKEAYDPSLCHTAARELREETGIELTLEQIGSQVRLSDLLTRSHNHLYPMVVTPYLWILDSRPAVQVNHESEGYYWIPTSLFERKNRKRFWWQANRRARGIPIALPMHCFYFEERKIWGLSLRMIEELISQASHP